MKSETKGPLADSIELYLAHKRSLGKELAKAEPILLMLDGNLQAQGVVELPQITAAHIDAFVASRPRRSPRSYNGLLGTIRGLLDWMVVPEVLPESPLRCETRRVTPSRRPFLFNADQARRLLEVAEQLPNNPRAQTRGETYKMIFALLYGLGLRVGEVSRLCRKDIDLDNQLLIIRQTKFGKDRLVPFGPKMARAITEFLDREESRFGPIPPESPTFSFNKRRRTPIGTNTISWAFQQTAAGASTDGSLRRGAAALTLPPPFVRRRHPVALVPGRRRSDDAFVGSFHLPGPRQPILDSRLLDHHHRTTGMCQ